MRSLFVRSTTRFAAYIAIALLLVVTMILVIGKVSHADTSQPTERGRLITIYDRGDQKVILTEATTVGDALAQAHVSLAKEDTVEPAASEKLVASEYKINIYRARPVIVVDGKVREKIMTPYQTPSQIASSAGIALYPEDTATLDRVDDLSEGAGLQLTIDRATPVSFVLYGKQMTIRTHAKTVADLLKEKSITLGVDDTVSVPVTQAITTGMNIELWRNGKQTVNVDEDVAFDTKQIQDADQLIGYKSIQTPGIIGKKTITYEIEMKNGVEVSRTAIQTVIITQPTQQVEIIGSKNNFSGSLNEWLSALRACETGGNYARNSGNGYYGAYQFLPSTWDATAKRMGRNDLVGVRPDLASPADQDALIINNTNASKGGLATQNPGCYKSLGLSQFPPN